MASAGTGKTWLLVTRLVRLLMDGARPDAILAITFTRKAAAEMHSRLAERLSRLAAGDDATLDYTALAAAVREVSATPCHLMESLARRILKRVQALDGVLWARVHVRKFSPPGMGDVAYVEVEEEGGTA